MKQDKLKPCCPFGLFPPLLTYLLIMASFSELIFELWSHMDMQIGPDILVSGFLQPVPDLTPTIPSVQETSAIDPTISPYESSIIFFYKTWDPYGAFSNFSLHPIQMPDENEELVTWSSVEHYYQVISLKNLKIELRYLQHLSGIWQIILWFKAQKFVGVSDPVAKSCIEELKCAKSPEEAARIGRRIQRQQPNLVILYILFTTLSLCFSMNYHFFRGSFFARLFYSCVQKA